MRREAWLAEVDEISVVINSMLVMPIPTNMAQ